MVFTNCVECNELITYSYEAGEKPCGRGVYAKVLCDNCGVVNYIERVSFDGETLDERTFKKRQHEELPP